MRVADGGGRLRVPGGHAGQGVVECGAAFDDAAFGEKTVGALPEVGNLRGAIGGFCGRGIESGGSGCAGIGIHGAHQGEFTVVGHGGGLYGIDIDDGFRRWRWGFRRLFLQFLRVSEDRFVE